MSRCLRELAHTPVEPEAPVQEAPTSPKIPIDLEAPIQEAKQLDADFVNLTEIESNRYEVMVTWKSMSIDRFVPDARQAT